MLDLQEFLDVEGVDDLPNQSTNHSAANEDEQDELCRRCLASPSVFECQSCQGWSFCEPCWSVVHARGKFACHNKTTPNLSNILSCHHFDDSNHSSIIHQKHTSNLGINKISKASLQNKISALLIRVGSSINGLRISKQNLAQGWLNQIGAVKIKLETVENLFNQKKLAITKDLETKMTTDQHQLGTIIESFNQDQSQLKELQEELRKGDITMGYMDAVYQRLNKVVSGIDSKQSVTRGTYSINSSAAAALINKLQLMVNQLDKLQSRRVQKVFAGQTGRTIDASSSKHVDLNSSVLCSNLKIRESDSFISRGSSICRSEVSISKSIASSKKGSIYSQNYIQLDKSKVVIKHPQKGIQNQITREGSEASLGNCYQVDLDPGYYGQTPAKNKQTNYHLTLSNRKCDLSQGRNKQPRNSIKGVSGYLHKVMTPTEKNQKCISFTSRLRDQGGVKLAV